MSQPIGPGFLKRSKRRWSPPPFNILENYSGSLPKGIERIVSDTQQNYSVYYTISGPGVDQHPIGLFSLNSKTGLLTVHKAIDREEFPSFKTDDPVIITIDIDDQNDNAPTFKDPLMFTVPERSAIGEVVGLVNATDRDLAGSLHTKIHFSLLSGQDLFGIHPETGVITTKTNTLDRETKDTHVVTVQIKDMAGADSGLSSQGQATIRLSDINDNPPTFNKTSYDASIQENDKDKLILRIPVKDKDLINTPNWVSKFVISKGNENGNFKIETDPKTNDGLLYVTKPLDYEKNKNVNLEIRAENQAKLSGTTAQWMSVPINVAVTDVDEGPEFTAPTVRYTVKENIANGTLIGTYSAVDPETKSSDGILYYKDSDPAGWINMDRTSGALRVANTIDRESHFVKNGMYNMTVKAVDSSSKTGSGTVIIVVEDMNDNMPTFPPGELILCEKEGEMGSVLLVAEDKDLSPYSAPFTFSIPSDSDGKWTVTRFNDTAATLQHVKELPTGMHEVPVLVKDLQGHGEVQTAMVRICECRGGVCLDKNRSAMFGGMGVLAMLLPLLLLLLLGEYLSSCPACRTVQETLDGRFAEDYSKAYGFEGVGSTAGSVGCCSDFGGDDNLEFLNALGPKFNTLADVCRKS
uniref:Cadherin domain-containing protein n=1 Tax=Salarias fasciatus TaxID=181472 RepID=A0A672FMH3_SALFA